MCLVVTSNSQPALCLSTVAVNSYYNFCKSDGVMYDKPVKVTFLACMCFAAGNPVAAEADVTNGNERIVNASDALPGQFPWAVSIQNNKRGEIKHFCMGALIDRRHVLTAGHCGKSIIDDPLRLKKFRVVLGAHDLENANETSWAIHKLCRFHMHPEAIKEGPWDIGIFTMTKPVTYTDRIKPIRLISHGTDPIEQPCSMAGWGLHKRARADSTKTNILRTVNVTLLSYKECHFPANDSMTCSTIIGGQEPSIGDGGATVICNDKNGPYAAAVYTGFNRSFFTSYYIKVLDALDFILCRKSVRG